MCFSTVLYVRNTKKTILLDPGSRLKMPNRGFSQLNEDQQKWSQDQQPILQNIIDPNAVIDWTGTMMGPDLPLFDDNKESRFFNGKVDKKRH